MKKSASYKPVSAVRKKKISESLKAYHRNKKQAAAKRKGQKILNLEPAPDAPLKKLADFQLQEDFINRFHASLLEKSLGQKKPEKTIFSEAEEIIYGDREKTYGKPSANLKTIASFWQNFLDHKNRYRSETLTPEDVCIMMILLKVSRQMNSFNRDSLVDICGYTGLIDRVNQELSFAAQTDAEIERRR